MIVQALPPTRLRPLEVDDAPPLHGPVASGELVSLVEELAALPGGPSARV